jgi:membrane protein DedA with SNARE-associated domain
VSELSWALLSLAVLTLASEDLACASAGLLVANGGAPFAAAAAACFVGILVGDLLLYWLGRAFGSFALERAPLRWFVSRAAVARGEAWFAAKGSRVLFAARFLPGARLPTYVAAGICRCPPGQFAFWLAFAGALWTPAAVALAAATANRTPGETPRSLTDYAQSWELWAAFGVLLLLSHGIPALATWQGRRMLLSRFRRLTRWEFWPAWFFNIPVVLHFLWLALRHRSLTLFTAANPGIPTGGLIGESKSQILHGLAGDATVARFRVLPAGLSVEGRLELVDAFLRDHDLAWPLVLKPDVGQRGDGVVIVASREHLHEHLRASATTAPDQLVQEHVRGEEFGVFYARHPEEAHGRLLSITGKVFPEVTGDGISPLRHLILADARAVCQAALHLRNLEAELDRVPAAGERVSLTRIGNHCRGTQFTDAGSDATPELLLEIERISRRFAAFFFGRFDLRAPTVADLRAGTNLRILELNGVASEMTHIYQPGTPLLRAYATLFAQWRLAFAIGEENVRRGARPTPLRELVGMVWRNAGPHPPALAP